MLRARQRYGFPVRDNGDVSAGEDGAPAETLSTCYKSTVLHLKVFGHLPSLLLIVSMASM